MRKIFTVVCAVIVSGLVLTSFSPSLDGRAVVADNGVMPQGVFAKTVGYLPGDSISVTNLAKKTNVDILVIGALDPSEGVAILLSPEAASLLGVERGGNTVVKITKRSGQLDESVSGTAVIGDAPETAESFGEETVPEEETAPDAEAPSDSAEETDFAEEENSAAEYVLVPEEEIPSEEDVSGVPEEETGAAAEEFVPPEEIALSEENGDSQEETVPFEKIDGGPDTEAASVLMPVDSEDGEPADSGCPDEEYAVSEEYVEDDMLFDDGKPQSSEAAEEEDVVALEPYSEELSEAECAEPDTEVSEADSLLSPEELPSAGKTEDMTESASGYEDNTDEAGETEEYEAIVLVPSEPNPPSESEIPETAAEECTALSGSEPAAADDDFAAYTVPSLGALERGAYYIQIGVYSERANIMSVLDRYAVNYPVVLVPLSNGKGTQILVGPLTVDEYGAVFNRFKSYGFKDAFLREIK